jgi:hypothetical protein
MSFLQAAFETIVPDRREPEQWFVCLVESVPFYGGPEEGGWWGRDTNLVVFREYPTREAALHAADAIRTLAGDLEREERRNHGRQMLFEMEWLEERGLDADYLPEPDGPCEYSVVVTQELPVSTRGCRHYE